jgi:hypothetical protein
MSDTMFVILSSFYMVSRLSLEVLKVLPKKERGKK